ncbi:site-specific DNA-methyltransferase, partial [Staphylococcus sp. GDK8D68P]
KEAKKIGKQIDSIYKDASKDEIMLNEVVSSDDISSLKEPKALSRITKYSTDYIEGKSVESFSENDNLILKGNNLIALHSLKKRYFKSIKGIFIDPPYYFNKIKPKDSFQYNSNFKLSTWLTFMKNRLEVAKDLLADDGIIAIVIGIDGYAHLKILMDELFEVNVDSRRYIGTITWRKTDNQSNIGDFANVIDYILLYRKNSNTKLNKLP